MTDKPLRSDLRLESYQRAMRMLRRAVEIVEPLEADELTLEEEGLIQRFEYCFELGWKLLKDLAVESAAEQDFKVGGPRDAIRWGYASGWIADGEVWMDMLRSRNLTTHAYDRHEVQPTLHRIRGSYLQALHGLQVSVEDAAAGR